MRMIRTPQFKHQAEEYEAHALDRARALFWEQGTGKTKASIDSAVALYQNGDIDAVLVLAPNGVQDAWCSDELPIHCAVPYASMCWSSRSAQTKRHGRAFDRLLSEDFPWLAISYDAFMTKAGRAATEKFVRERRALGVADESQRIKTPGAKRTKAATALGRKLAARRILSGTPVTNSPFDIYSQIRFLDAEFWRRNGFASYEAFKGYFGIWEERINSGTGQRFRTIVQYRNLDRLREIVRPISSRVLKAKVLDLPPKLYSKVYFDLEPGQRRAYSQMRDELLVELDSGELVEAPLIVTRLLRLQQISCGYLPSEDGERVTRFPKNPRLDMLRSVLEDVEGKAIIFARFREDIDQIMGLLGGEAVRYDGAVADSARRRARMAFQKPGGPRWFVGNPAACGVGLTLHAAATIVYYSNSFSLEHRLQSEDRAHRIGQGRPVRIVDLVARDTVDHQLVRALSAKFDVASKITGDEVRRWL